MTDMPSTSRRTSEVLNVASAVAGGRHPEDEEHHQRPHHQAGTIWPASIRRELIGAATRDGARVMGGTVAPLRNEFVLGPVGQICWKETGRKVGRLASELLEK